MENIYTRRYIHEKTGGIRYAGSGNKGTRF